MFGRWLALKRDGPDLLPAGAQGADPNAHEPVDCGGQPQHAFRLSSENADARIAPPAVGGKPASLLYDP